MLEQLPQNIISGLLTGGLYALVGIGLALIFGVMRVVNFAHGELLMIGMYVTYFLFEKAGIDPYISLLIGMPLLFILGAVIQRVLIDPVLEAPEMNQILLTVGLGLVLTNTVQLLFTADYRQIRTSYSETTLRPLGLFVNVPYLISFLVALALAIALYWFLMKTDFGRSLRATAQNREAAKLMGINVRTVSMGAFGIGTALAGAAGALLTPVYYLFPAVGETFGLKSFVIVVLGGMGSVVGAAVGGIALGVAEAVGVGLGIGNELKDLIGFVVFVLVLIFKPSGLMGRSRA